MIARAAARRRARRRAHARRRRGGRDPRRARRRIPTCGSSRSRCRDAPEDVIAVIRAGARGYVTKTISGPELVDADPARRRRRRGVLAAARRASCSTRSPHVPGRRRRSRARPAHAARARGAAPHRARATRTRRSRAQLDISAEDRRDPRVVGAAQAAALEPPRAHPLGDRTPHRCSAVRGTPARRPGGAGSTIAPGGYGALQAAPKWEDVSCVWIPAVGTIGEHDPMAFTIRVRLRTRYSMLPGSYGASGRRERKPPDPDVIVGEHDDAPSIQLVANCVEIVQDQLCLLCGTPLASATKARGTMESWLRIGRGACRSRCRPTRGHVAHVRRPRAPLHLRHSATKFAYVNPVVAGFAQKSSDFWRKVLVNKEPTCRGGAAVHVHELPQLRSGGLRRGLRPRGPGARAGPHLPSCHRRPSRLPWQRVYEDRECKAARPSGPDRW